MPIFLTVHTLLPGSATPHRSFHRLAEGRIAWLPEAPGKSAVVGWRLRMGLQIGDPGIAVFKATDVSLAKN